MADETVIIKKSSRESLIVRMLKGMAALAYRHPYAIVIIGVLLCLVSVYYTHQNLYFDPDRGNLIRRSAELQKSQDRYLAEFPQAEDMVVLVEDGTDEDRRQFVDDLEKALKQEPQTFSYVFGKTELSFVRSHALQYVDADTLKDLAGTLENNLPLIKGIAKASSFSSLIKAVPAKNIKEPSDSEIIEALPVVNAALDQLLTCIKTRGHYKYVSPIIQASGNDSADIPEEIAQGSLAIYNTLSKGRIYLLLARPVYPENVPSDEAIEKSVLRMREILETMQRSHPKVLVSLTGELVLDVDESLVSTSDSYNATVASLILVALVFAAAFREFYRPLMAVFTLVIGVGWTMGFATLAVGHLNLLTVTFCTILIGLGIDFGIHFIYRYDEERVAGLASLEAMQETLAGAGRENLTGAFSTAIAFWVLIFTDFIGIAELGIIAGTGILLCYLAMALVLPALLFIQERFKGDKAVTGISNYKLLAFLEQLWLKKAGAVVVICTLITLWCIWEARTVRYDYNILNLQSQGLESVRSELHLINSSNHSLLNGITLAKSPDEARRFMELYEKMPGVSAVESVAELIPSDFSAKQPWLTKIKTLMAQVPAPKPFEAPDEGSKMAEMAAMGCSFVNAEKMVRSSLHRLKHNPDKDIRRQAEECEEKIEALFEMLGQMGPGAIQECMGVFERDMFTDIYNLVTLLKDQQDGPPLEIKDIPENLRSREIGRGGLIQVRVFPKENVWERSAQEKFALDMQKIDPQAVGMPIMAYYDTQELRHSNEVAGIYALAAIWVLLFVHFRKVKITLLALFPKVVGVIWMVGIMGYCGVDFNSANFLALPLILGIGLVFGVHVVHRSCEEGSDGIFGHSTGPAIAMSGLTTMIGFGSLIVARHHGVSSLGFIMTAGVGSNLLTSVVFLPALMAYLKKRGIKIDL